MDDFEGMAAIYGPSPRKGRKAKAGKGPTLWTYVALGVAALAVVVIVYAVLSELVS